MCKLKYEDKINIYKERKNGISLSNLSKKYKVGTTVIKYLVRLIDKHGFDIIKTNTKRTFPSYEKERIINRVILNNETIGYVAIDEGLLNQGMLSNWIKNYKKMGYNIVERKRGRPTMNKEKPKSKKKETKDETIKRLEEENLYLKAELEYSKKLRAVVQARKNRQQKKK